MNWDECAYQYLQTGWFDYEDRPKTVIAMQTLVERVPAEVFDEITVLVFAPSPDADGQVFPPMIIPTSIIYLAPILEQYPQEEVDFIVALEFAYAFLGHSNEWASNPASSEDDADNLVKKWGYVMRERRE